jgi:hypothetical protein
LLDEDHSRLQASWKSLLERWDWQVVAEASFNRYGERGRMDLVAWHSRLRILVVVEIKTVIADVQGLLGPLDVKVRVAPAVAQERGWGRPDHVVPCLVVAEAKTNRRRLETLSTLFSQFSLRGRSAISWLRRPDGAGAPGGLMIFSDLSPAGHSSANRVGRQRIRQRAVALSVATDPEAAKRGARGG